MASRMTNKRTTIVPYRDSAFRGGAVSYAAQGMCSANDGRGATYMLLNRRGAAFRAVCDEHAAPHLLARERWREDPNVHDTMTHDRTRDE